MSKKETMEDIKLLNSIADREYYDKKGRVPIVIAAQFNLTNIADSLIKDGADVNELGNGNKTALFVAASRGYRYMCGVLLEAGADPNISSYGVTPIGIARQKKHPSVVDLLSNWNDKQEDRKVK